MKPWLHIQRLRIQQLLEITEHSWQQKLYLAPLFGLSRAYLAAGRWREEAYRIGILPAARLDCRVICVGNLTVGGTGKTPTVELVCRTLQQRGERVGIISRGYGRRPPAGAQAQDVLVVSDGRKILASSQAAGDEPLMLAVRLPGVPVLVGRNRYQAGAQALRKFNLQTLVLDDGFQHLQLARDLNILVLDGRKPFGNGYGLPAGKLRESPRALARADMILLTRISGHDRHDRHGQYDRPDRHDQPDRRDHYAHRDQGDQNDRKVRAEKEIRKYNFKAPIVVGHHQPRDLVSLQGDQILSLDALKGKAVAALCAIADPDSFAATLKALGARVVQTLAFPDHHWYSMADIRQVERRVSDEKVWGLLTTEKDAVRLPPGSLRYPVWVLRIDMTLVDGKEIWEKKLNQRQNSAILSRIGSS
ncbi:MAG: tetraacyldisaccharide 4'-kinase [bacterium]